MRSEASGTIHDSRRGMRQTAAVRAVDTCPGSFLRKSGSSPALHVKLPRTRTSIFLFWFLAAVLISQVGALPVQLGLLLLPKGAAPVTEGCSKGTCCTPLCYVDKYGIHHCVHLNGDSCECGLSAGDMDAVSILLSTLAILPDQMKWSPDLLPTGWVFQRPGHTAFFDPATPSPPPKQPSPNYSFPTKIHI